MIKKMTTILSVMAIFGAVTLSANQADAKNMCHEVTHYKGMIDHLNKGLASEGAEGMASALKKIGIDPSKKTMKGGKFALKLLIQSQEGSLYTALRLAQAGCNAEKIAEKAKKATLAAFHHASDAVHNIASALTHHRHLVCKRWGHGWHRHYACRWRG
jgi:RNA 3'-terminal phosphate cyclase